VLTNSGLRLGIGLPQLFPNDAINTNVIQRFAQRAEELGYEDLWLSESILGARGVLEPVTLLAYAAACTTRIRLGVSVIILNQRNPVVLAKALATLDQLSDGRLTVGLGLGGGTAAYPTFGISPERPVARFTESLQVMRMLWSEERAELRGTHWQLDGAALAPKPRQQPLPVWLGGHAPAALRRAVRLANGWMGAGGSPIEDFFVQIAQIRGYLTDAGRSEDSFTLSKRVYIAVDTDGARARERLAAGLGGQYGRGNMAERVGVAGTPEECVAVLRRLRDAGLHHLLLHPYPDFLQQLELLSSEVAPLL
jgi:probable F420-dependent oxidoreductase